METREYTVYKFDELSDAAKNRALENLRYINVDDSFWHECILDSRKDDLAEIGFKDAKIFFSGFSSQGDGASFTCTVDLVKWFEARPMNKQAFPAMFAECEESGNYHISIAKNGRYEHEMTMSVNSRYYGDNDIADSELDALEEVILEDARDQDLRLSPLHLFFTLTHMFHSPFTVVLGICTAVLAAVYSCPLPVF